MSDDAGGGRLLMRRSTLHRGAEASDNGKGRRQPSRFGSLAQCVLLAVSLLGVGVLLQAVRLGRSPVDLAYASSGAVHAPSTAEAEGRAERQQVASAVQAKAAGGSSAAAPEATPAVRHRAESSQALAAPAGSPKEPFFLVIGTPSGTDRRNVERRMILRDLWFTEYDNIGKTVGAEFLMSLMTAQGEAQPEAVAKQLHDELNTYGDMVLLHAREPTSDPNRRHPVNSGEKVLAWFRCAVVQHHGAKLASTLTLTLPPAPAPALALILTRYAVVQHYGAKFFIKADWDTWVHTTKLELNLRLLASLDEPAHYFGVTVWCSYSVADFQPCGYGLGPLMASNLQKAKGECPELPGGAAAIGPFPFTVGMMWGMSSELVRWIVNSRWVYDFSHNASGRFKPPYWVKGEDSAFGLFAHLSPFAMSARHWGWEKLHDSYEVGWAEKGINAHKVHAQSLAVHAMQKRSHFEIVRQLMRDACNESCIRTPLKFEVDGLKDLCKRNPNIPKVYSKCELAGYAKAANVKPLEPPPIPRPICKSHSNRSQPHILEEGVPGGYIRCEPEPEVGSSRRAY
jgi:hypothetical protein